MRPFTRLPPPQYLTENWEIWGNRYAQNKAENAGHTFQWATHEGQRMNLKLLPFLTSQTQNHCSYCDAYPMKISDETIDHFKPKGNARFYHLAYHWENLYYCCADCQKAKWEQFSGNLLRPDTADFSFNRYFIVNYLTGEIQANPTATVDEKHCAEETIKILGLNHTAQCVSRRHSLERYNAESDIDDFAYRFMFEF